MAAAAFSDRPPAVEAGVRGGADPAGAAASVAPQKLQNAPEVSWWQDGHCIGFLLLRLGLFRGEQGGAVSDCPTAYACPGKFGEARINWRAVTKENAEIRKGLAYPAPNQEQIQGCDVLFKFVQG